VKGRPLAKGGYRKAWEQVKEKANLEDLNVHDLRSVHATQSLESAVIGQIQQQLGHATPEMTERYLRPVAEAKRAMLDAALASALSKSL
jgi:integrase